MPDTDDLWPANIADTNLTTPITILKQQAALLGQKTQQLATGEVTTQTLGDRFVHSFRIWLLPSATGSNSFRLPTVSASTRSPSAT